MKAKAAPSRTPILMLFKKTLPIKNNLEFNSGNLITFNFENWNQLSVQIYRPAE